MRSAIVLVVAMAAAVAVAADADAFAAFKAAHGKVYASEAEEAQRRAIFMANMDMVATWNADEGEAIFGASKFADLTQQEFQQLYLMPKSVLANGSPAMPNERVPEIPVGDLPKQFDWRDKPGTITPVKDQGQCGSCWAFSATQNIESVWAIQGGHNLTKLSVQQIVSCDNVDDGCNGGDTPTAYQYVIKAGGLETEAQYPYKSGGGNTLKCEDRPKMNHAKIDGFDRITTKHKNNETAMMSYLVNTAPLSVCVDAETWQFYTGGIVKRRCGRALDHCVVITGYNNAAATGYWIVKNSWSETWGEKGYIYIELGDDLCGIADEATSSFIKN